MLTIFAESSIKDVQLVSKHASGLVGDEPILTKVM